MSSPQDCAPVSYSIRAKICMYILELFWRVGEAEEETITKSDSGRQAIVIQQCLPLSTVSRDAVIY
jgi:hypothetical protein